MPQSPLVPEGSPKSLPLPPRILLLGLQKEEDDALTLAFEARGWQVQSLSNGSLATDVNLIVATPLAWHGHARACREFEQAVPELAVVLVLGAEDRNVEPLPAAAEYLERPLSPCIAVHRIERVLAGLAGLASAQAEETGFVVQDLLAGRSSFHQALESAIARTGRDELALVCTVEIGLEGVDKPSQGSVHQHVGLALSTLRREAGEGAEPIAEHAAGRLKPGQYALFLAGAFDEKRASSLAARLHELITHRFEEQWGEAAPAVYVGFAFDRGELRRGLELLERADTATYCTRQQRRSRVQAFSEPMSRWAHERKLLVDGLHHAADRGELVVYYQPRIDAQTRRVLGMEALVRWVHPELGLVAPGRFIPLAEESGLIVPIGEWVLREACRQNKAWQDAGFAPVRISVNLSAVQFRRNDLFDTVERALAEVGLDPSWLELELTESMLMNDPRTTIATLERFKSAGIHLSIDDFGTGYSSLSYLRHFPIDALKIDQSFVREITTNRDDAAIATAIILMGHSLKLSVVAEGVETESQLSFLQILQCNEVQGFLISPPVPTDRAETFLLPLAVASMR